MENVSSRQSSVPSRRAFLKTSGAVLGAMVARSPRMAYAVDTAPKKVRIGVIGGGFGSAFPWHEHPDCVVQAVSDLREDRREILAKAYSCSNVYPSLEALVKDPTVDAVSLFTEGTNHVPHAIECLKHGKHVLSAVPACWGSVEEGERLLEAVKSSGLTYMMAETSYYQQSVISARKFYEEGAFGDLFYCESEYYHPGIEALWFWNGKSTWRHGTPPMSYPTHCTERLMGVTGERLVSVTCQGWGDDKPPLKGNPYNNPFWNATALFTTDRGHAFRMQVFRRGAIRGCDRATWIGDKMSFHMPPVDDEPATLVHAVAEEGRDDAGFMRHDNKVEEYEVPQWWKTDLLPEPLRHDSGHQGSHTFLTHEFIDALIRGRRPTVDIYEALNYTIPGIIAHRSALEGGELMKIPQFTRPKT